MKGSRHRDAVSVLREKIQSGAFAVGERLREVALSESLGMSRTPVREALRTLAAEG
ncbi:MAG: GntR family transcriptional regulator, partial [Pseudomonadota bacterium]